MSMETAATSTTGGTGLAAAQRRRTLGELIAISIFWFALNFHWAVVAVLLVPSQVIGLLAQQAPAGTLAEQATWVNNHAGLTQAIVVAPGLIVALFANPYFGLLSDRTPGRFGRRRPYILGGTLLNAVGLAVMALGPGLLGRGAQGALLSPGLFLLMGGLMLTQFANNAAAAPFHALLPDLVPREQRGLASGIMGLAYWMGTIGGSIAPLFFGFNSQQLLDGVQTFAAYERGIILTYGVTIAVIVAMALLTILTVREQPWRPEHTSAEQHAAERHTTRDLLQAVAAVALTVGLALALFNANLGLKLDETSLSIVQLLAVIVAGVGAARAFGFRPRRNPDFTWVVVTRMLVMLGVYIVQNFLLLYMQNVAHAPSPQQATTQFLVLLTLAATLSTVGAGWASDRVGRKRMVYLSGSFMAVVGVVFVVAPYLLPGNVLTIALVMGAIFGLGFGAYVSVDWALVADVLPSEETFARDMGVWNIGLTLPQVFALVFGGWLLGLGVWLGDRSLGYTFLFVWFVLFCLAGTVTVRYIRGTR